MEVKSGKPEAQSQEHESLREGRILGNSPQMNTCLEIVSQAARSDANVLVVGETGTGKELIARAIHNRSSRAKGAMMVVDCTVLPETLVGSLLFGYDKGAFTNADEARDGLIRQAHCGTLFLDEVGELPQSIQKLFLRVLQEHRFRPLGGGSEMESDFRLIAATNQNLDQKVAHGLFRADLLFRIRSYVIEVPPLRERRKDITELLSYYTGQLCRRYDLTPKEMTPEFIRTATLYHWPGNVRELINVLEHALFAARYESFLFAKHLPTYIRSTVAKASLHRQPPARPHPTRSVPQGLPNLHDFRQVVFTQAETRYLRELIIISNRNIHTACQLSGLSRSRLYALMKKRDIPRIQ
jgi:two-component system NtrC family response regulator